MKRFTYYIYGLLAWMFSATALAQNCDVPMAVEIDPQFSEVTPEAATNMTTQLERLASQAGLDVGWESANFTITAKMVQTDRHVVGTAPTQIAGIYTANIYIVDVYRQKLFSSIAIDLRGAGTNETKAFANALRGLNANNTQLMSFLKVAKQKVVNYYDSQLDRIIKEARAKSTMKQYDEALAMLAVVPACCNGYDRAMKEALNIYLLYRDTYALAQLNKAKALWAANPTQEAAREVAELLASVDPDSKCYGEAMGMLKEVGRSVKTDVDFERKKKYEDAVSLERERIKAIGEIGKAYAASVARPVNFMFLR